MVTHRPGDELIPLDTAIPQQHTAQAAPRPPPSFGSARAIIVAFLTGRLRKQYYSDVRVFDEARDATTQVAAGYICLAAAHGMALSMATLVAVNPGHIEAHVMTAMTGAGCVYGFSRIRRRQDPRLAMEWLVLLHLVAVAVISYRHAGLVAPAVASLPTTAVIAALFMRPRMRPAALVLGLGVAICVFLFASGLAGVPSTYTPQTHAMMAFLTVAFSTVALGGLAWIANLARDYALERLGEANAQIVENASRVRIALDAAKVGLWDVPDAEQRQFHVSENFESITGYTARQFNKAFVALDRFVHPEDIVPLREAFALGRQRLSRLRVDFRLMTRTRGYRWFSVRARYSRNPDGSIRISGSLQDINFIKAAEEALRNGRDQAREASKAKSDFIAVMSHEVRTPLNAILGSVEVLKRHKLDREADELVGLIDDAGRGLMTVVNDLLDVSRIEAGKLEIVLAPTDLSLLLRRTVDFWRPQASHKGLGLHVDCSSAAAGVVMIDAGRVRQVIGNLVSNAVKFTDTGDIVASLSTHERPDGRTEVIISVGDTGPGIPAAIADRIFAPFEQAPSNSGRGGAGLGLFISRRLARLMGGDLKHERARGRGSLFRLTLNATRSTETDRNRTGEGDDPVWLGKRVLCVDDNRNNQRITELLLGKFGIDVQICASGAEAIDLCAIETFDVILMDIVMPEMDGVETLKRLRGDPHSLNRATPAIALTAKLSAADVASYVAAGFEGVAGKPINVRELVQTMAPFMAGKALADAARD